MTSWFAVMLVTFGMVVTFLRRDARSR
jgi:hypothetical protein